MSTLIYPKVPAIQYAREQSAHGPPFSTGSCLAQCSQAFLGHPSGQLTAVLGWDASHMRHPFRKGSSLYAFLGNIPRGFPVWFAGGSPTENHPEGDGHVVISGTRYSCWSTDRKRNGFFDRVPLDSILKWNPSHPLTLLGWSEDIAGFELDYAPHSKDAHT